MANNRGGHREPDAEETRHPSPRPAFLFFAAVFVAMAAFNLWREGSESVTIFLCTAALITLGVDVGKMIGRR